MPNTPPSAINRMKTYKTFFSFQHFYSQILIMFSVPTGAFLATFP